MQKEDGTRNDTQNRAELELGEDEEITQRDHCDDGAAVFKEAKPGGSTLVCFLVFHVFQGFSYTLYFGALLPKITYS